MSISPNHSLLNQPTLSKTSLNIGIIGCGWLGQHLAQKLSTTHQLYTTTTSAEKNAKLLSLGYHSELVQFTDDQTIETPPWHALHKLDALIITVPFSKRFSNEQLQHRFSNIAQFCTGYTKQLFLMSSIGIYPELPMDISEFSLPDSELNSAMLGVEHLIQKSFPQVNILRLGGLMGGSRVFSNYVVEPSNQVVNHIHYEDIVSIIEKMIQKQCCAKTYHIVAPLHPTKQEVLTYQKGHYQATTGERMGKTINAELVRTELNYTFIHPDPRTFI